MDAKNPKTLWVEALFDVAEPYVYILVLPALVMFVLGYRGQAVVVTLGAATLITVLNDA